VMPAEITAGRLSSLFRPRSVGHARIEALDAAVTWTRKDES
jgi:hypothetical protein